MYVKLKFASADTCDQKKTQIDVSNKPPPTLKNEKLKDFFKDLLSYTSYNRPYRAHQKLKR